MEHNIDNMDFLEYLKQLPEDRKRAFEKLRSVIIENLPVGFEEQVGTFVDFVVPFSIYPKGYHCNTKQPLPFMSIASQKNFIALYHMGLYANPELLEWFVQTYPKYSSTKLDMGKSCIRFKKVDQIPMELIAELCKKMMPSEWIELYEKTFVKK